MNRRVVIVVGLLAVCGLSALSVTLFGLGQYRRDVAVPRAVGGHQDLGIVYPQTIRRVSFPIRNETRRTIVFDRIRTSCGCASAHLDQDKIAPGETATLLMAVRTEEKPGLMSVQALVEASSDGVPHVYRFDVSGTVANVVELSDTAYYLQLGEANLQHLPLKKEIMVTRGTYPLQWDDLQCHSNNPRLTAQVVRVDADHWQLNLQMDSEDLVGEINSRIDLLFFQDGKKLDYTVTKPVVASIVGPVAASPKSILVGSVRPGQTQSHTIQFLSSGSVRILSASAGDAKNVTVEANRDEGSPMVRFVYTGGDRAGFDQGDVTVEVEADRRYIVKVPYLASVVAESTTRKGAE